MHPTTGTTSLQDGRALLLWPPILHKPAPTPLAPRDIQDSPLSVRDQSSEAPQWSPVTQQGAPGTWFTRPQKCLPTTVPGQAAPWHTQRGLLHSSVGMPLVCTKPAPSCSPDLHKVPPNFTQDANHLHITHSLTATGQKATKHPNLATRQNSRGRNSRVAHANKPQTHRPPQAPREVTIWNYFERCSCHRHKNLPPMLTGHNPA